MNCLWQVLFFAVLAIFSGYLVIPDSICGRWSRSARNYIGILITLPLLILYYFLNRNGFSFTFTFLGNFIGLGVFLLIWHFGWKPRIRAAEERLIRQRAAELNLGDRRPASLRPRRISDYIPEVARWFPFALYILFALLAFRRSPEPLVEARDVSNAAMCLFYGAFFLMVGEIGMQRRVAAPTDLRSTDPVSYEALVEQSRKADIRFFWLYQLIAGTGFALFGALSVEEARGTISMEAHTLVTISIPLFIAGIALFYSFDVARRQDELEVVRWAPVGSPITAPLVGRKTTWLETASPVLFSLAFGVGIGVFTLIPTIEVLETIHDPERQLRVHGTWEIVPFESVDAGTPELREAARRLEALAKILDRGARSGAQYSHGSHWPVTADDWKVAAAEISKADSSLLVTPWGTSVEYVFTDEHHSYMLDAYDPTGQLAISYLGGASHRVGPIPYMSPAMLKTPVGRSTENMIWNQNARASPVNHLVADAWREEEHADVGLMNFLGVRAHIPKGTVTVEHLRFVIPFREPIAVVEMTGEQLVDQIESSISGPIPYGVSGLRRRGPGDYVTSSGEPIIRARKYRVATSTYIADGGRYDEYAAFRSYPRLSSSKRDLADVVAAYIQRHSPISPDEDSRLAGIDKS